MKKSVLIGLLAVVMVWTAMAAPAQAEALWTIGVRDRTPREFALAPGGYARFRNDGYYAVGRSRPERDWPYIHPGPDDGWAGSRRHTFNIGFGATTVPNAGTGSLNIHVTDTHPAGAPRLRIRVNGQTWDRATIPGGRNASYDGDLSQARPDTIRVDFPLSLLKPGVNAVSITSLSGSWLLYDAIEMDAPGVTLGETEPIHVLEAGAEQVLLRKPGGPVQPVHLTIHQAIGQQEVELAVNGRKRTMTLVEGLNRITLDVPPVRKAREIPLRLEARVDGRPFSWTGSISLKPVRNWTVYLLPHSHVDIGYTAFQEDVLRQQMANLDTAIELSRKTDDYPDGARFKWNSEVLWAMEPFWKQAPPDKKNDIRSAIRKGWLELEALFVHELTALCRPEELVQLLKPSVSLGHETGKPITTAMITDVPGYTWGIVPVLAGSGVKYFSIGPNPNDRIGLTARAWADRPFYWKSPSGQEKVLCWMTGTSYNWFHSQTLAQKGDGPMLEYLGHLDEEGYPYDLVQVRYTVGGDNGPPDQLLPDTVKAWNERYASPRLVLATATEAFQALESRYGKVIPTVSGDFTPYWEDGAASSARETAMNRASAERLSQAETLWAVRRPRDPFPSERADAAWRNVVMYSEHTWGAHNSIREPDSDFVKRQWAYKKAFADIAEQQSQDLIAEAVATRTSVLPDMVDVLNSTAWPRTDLVTLSAAMSRMGDRVLDAEGRPVPSQRLQSGELVFLAGQVPAFGMSRFRVSDGPPPQGTARASGTELNTRNLRVTVDPGTGEITRLERGLHNAAKTLNRYLYVPGTDPKNAVTTGPAAITVIENGPLVAELEIRSTAPGTLGLVRRIRIVDKLDRVEIGNTLDKKAIREKEGVHFLFDFNVPDGVVRMETPWAVVRPEIDQLPGACKNWFTVQRWVDVSNAGTGVTMAPLDAPLIEIGGITAETPWLETIAPSQTIVSYVMNNYWHTNYKADQSGPTTFRYALQLHDGFDALEAARFGMAMSRPLTPVRASGVQIDYPLLTVEPASVTVETLRPLEGGRGWLVRLYGASGKDQRVTLNWRDPQPRDVFESDLTGRQGRPAGRFVDVPAWGMVTLLVKQ